MPHEPPVVFDPIGDHRAPAEASCCAETALERDIATSANGLIVDVFHVEHPAADARFAQSIRSDVAAEYL
jgi:hypothetical protein